MKKAKTLGIVLAASAAAMFSTGCHHFGSSYADHHHGHHDHHCGKGKCGKKAHTCNAKNRHSCKKAGACGKHTCNK